MVGRIIELNTPGRSIRKERGFLVISEQRETLGRVPLDDIEAVISSTPGLYWSGNALAALAERSVPVVFVGSNFTPVAHILPLAAHHAQGTIMQAQADASLPLKKRLWAQIIKAKIEAQGEILKLVGKPEKRLERLKSEVRSGDSGNREAVAAQHYWPKLMGADFRRDRTKNDGNSLLNYGYTVLRAATARAIVATGLNPSLSLHHASSGDALRLADDLMEPFRPAIDITVHDLLAAGQSEIDGETKAALVDVLLQDYDTSNGHTPLSHVLVRLCRSLAKTYQGEEQVLDLPSPVCPVIDANNEEQV